jgi:APA family basic amino acid/polyamine antiporter
MLGVGILRLPGTVAAAAGSPTVIIICWCLGALYALMGAVSVSELAAMYPEAGGFRVYARRAFGDRAGFVVGWIDWLASVATIAYAAVSAIEFLATLLPSSRIGARVSRRCCFSPCAYRRTHSPRAPAVCGCLDWPPT